MNLDEAIAAKKAAEDKFVEICRRGRDNPEGVHIREFARNFSEYQTACEAIWEGMFKNIADTGVKIQKSWI
jgi:hypothetical protein